MKILKLTLIFSVFLSFSAKVFAETPATQLQKLTAQFKKTPTDDFLREKIIKFAKKNKLSPNLSPEAERHMVRGGAAFRDATSVSNYQDAAKEFEQVTLLAPWLGDAYYNLGVAQDKAKNFAGALQSLKFAQMASPNSKEIQTLIYEIEYRKEKESSPEAFVASLEGAIYICPEFRNEDDAWQVEINIKDAKITGRNVITWLSPKMVPGVNYAKNAYVGFRGLWFDDIPLKGKINTQKSMNQEMLVEITADQLIFFQQITYAGQSSPTIFPPQTCLRKK